MTKGSIVKFHTPMGNEDPKQEFVLLFIYPAWTQEFVGGSRTYPAKADIKALNTGMFFAGVQSVELADLVEIDNVGNYNI